MADLSARKKDFPIFRAHPDLVFFDSAASAQKPQVVIDAERNFYEQTYANVHRGLYALSQQATNAYEAARDNIRRFINAQSVKEIVYTRNATEAINLVAASYGSKLQRGDVVLLSEMEHHSNILPWQKLRDEQGIIVRWIPVTDDGDLDLTNIDALLAGVKLVAITQMSNVLGVVNDVKLIAAKAHATGATILVDGAQSVPHLPVDVQDLDCDWLTFSGHKMLGPMGIGVLYGKQELLEAMPPFLRGGDMILEVTKEAAVWNDLPYKFEAGTPNAAGAIGLGAAVEYLSGIGMDKIWRHEQELTAYGLQQLAAINGVKVLGAKATSSRGAIFSMVFDGIHPHDIGSILDEQGIAVRAGSHCAMPLHQRFGIQATSRASCYLYNSVVDIDALVRGLHKVNEVFK